MLSESAVWWHAVSQSAFIRFLKDLARDQVHLNVKEMSRLIWGYFSSGVSLYVEFRADVCLFCTFKGVTLRLCSSQAMRAQWLPLTQKLAGTLLMMDPGKKPGSDEGDRVIEEAEHPSHSASHGADCEPVSDERADSAENSTNKRGFVESSDLDHIVEEDGGNERASKRMKLAEAEILRPGEPGGPGLGMMPAQEPGQNRWLRPWPSASGLPLPVFKGRARMPLYRGCLFLASLLFSSGPYPWVWSEKGLALIPWLSWNRL